MIAQRNTVIAFIRALSCALFSIYAINGHAVQPLVGLSVHSDLRKDYFIVALHSEETETIDINRDDVSRSIDIRIVSDKLYSRQFARIWVNGSAINSKKSEFYKNTQSIIEFTQCIKGNLQRGDAILVSFDPETGTSLSVNGTFIHNFSDPSFFNLLLSVLIGEVPLSSKMKRELLSFSIDSIDERTRDLYTTLTPSASRIEITQSWAMMKNGAYAKMENPQVAITKSSEKKDPAKLANKPRTKTTKNSATVAKKVVATTHVPKNTKASSNTKKTLVTEEYNPFTIETLLAERDFVKVVTAWISKISSYPVLVAERPEKDSIKFTVTVDKAGQLLNISQFEKSKYSALNKGSLKLLEKSAPFPSIPAEIQDDSVDLDLYFYLHWRYLR